MNLNQIRVSLVVLTFFTVLTGIVYPLAVTGVSRLLFAAKANGSLLEHGGVVIGSELIGQPFDSPKYFWSRLSASIPFPYNGASSTGSNYGPLNPSLLAAAQDRLTRLRAADSSNTQPVPIDLVTASGSGLDPHISIAAALWQIPRVARARNLPDSIVEALVRGAIRPRGLGFLGEPGVNVLELNLALDHLSSKGN